MQNTCRHLPERQVCAHMAACRLAAHGFRVQVFARPDHFGADEAPLEVGVNHTRRLWAVAPPRAGLDHSSRHPLTAAIQSM